MTDHAQKITKQNRQGRNLVFYPKSEDEAAFVQRELIKLGCVWADGSKFPALERHCVATGIFVNKMGIMKCDVAGRDSYTYSTSQQLGEGYITPDQRFVLETVNKVNESVDQKLAEMRQLMEEMRTEQKIIAKNLPQQKKGRDKGHGL